MRIAALLLCVVASPVFAQATWTIDRIPLMDLAGADANGVVRFENPAGGTRLANGSLLIADRGANTVRLLDGTGRQLKRVGQTGDGPGDFQAMIWAGRCGRDSLLVWDLRRRKASFVDASATIGNQFSVPSDSGTKVRAPLNMIACGGGRIGYISEPHGRMPAVEQNIMRMLSSAVLAGPDGRVSWRQDSLPSGEMAAVVSPTGGRGGFPRPLGVSTSVAFSGDRFVVGASDSARLTLYAPDGSHRSILLPLTAGAPTAEERDAAIAALTSMAPPSMRQSASAQLMSVPLPKTRPLFSGLFGDPAGLIWVQLNPVGGKPIDLLAVTNEGKVTARAQLPIPMTIWEIGTDYVLGSYSDANDEPHIAVYRLRRR